MNNFHWRQDLSVSSGELFQSLKTFLHCILSVITNMKSISADLQDNTIQCRTRRTLSLSHWNTDQLFNWTYYHVKSWDMSLNFTLHKESNIDSHSRKILKRWWLLLYCVRHMTLKIAGYMFTNCPVVIFVISNYIILVLDSVNDSRNSESKYCAGRF